MMKKNCSKRFLFFYLVFLILGILALLLFYFPLVDKAALTARLPEKSRFFCRLAGILFLILLDLFSLLLPFAFCRIFYLPLKKTIALSDSYLGRGQGVSVSPRQSTEFTHLQENMKALADTSQNAAIRQKTALANITHDFRSPLTSIKGFTEALLDGTISPADSERYLKIILNMTNQLTRLSDDILALSRMEPRAFYLSTFDINELIFSLASAVELRCRDKHLRLVLSLEKYLPDVAADRDKIMQAILNLVDNAIKFSDPGTDITIRTWEQADQVHVSVRDFGDVIPRNELSKIFESHYMVDASRSGKKQGHGLGLSIVREIMNMHGVDVEASSSAAEGTVFFFGLNKAPKRLT